MGATDRDVPLPAGTPVEGPHQKQAKLDQQLDASLTQLEQQVDSAKLYLASYEPAVPPPRSPR